MSEAPPTPGPRPGGFRPLRIARTEFVAEDIRSFELVSISGAELPPFTAGSHVRVRTPSGAQRKYSLCNDPAERHRYVIAVKRDATGQGGSVSLVDNARDGGMLPVSAPDNAFPLVEGAKRYLFIAGGIGITPILSMIRALAATPDQPWQLVYLTRSPEATPFRDVLADPAWKARVTIHHDRGDPARAYDLWPALEKPNTGHVYCCGPRPLMESVRDMTGHWSAKAIHFESFVEGGGTRADDRPFTVRLARAGTVHEVPIGATILGVLRAAGHTLPSSCESGTCGTCRTRLLAGAADHRDMVLMPDEHDTQIMICVSRAKGGELLLDL